MVDANGTMLRITQVPSVVVAGYMVLGRQVTDATAAVRELTAAVVAFTRYDGMDQDADGIWTAPGGGRIAWFVDPDGNTLSVAQL